LKSAGEASDVEAGRRSSASAALAAPELLLLRRLLVRLAALDELSGVPILSAFNPWKTVCACVARKEKRAECLSLFAKLLRQQTRPHCM
jgi:hypothetical protein